MTSMVTGVSNTSVLVSAQRSVSLKSTPERVRSDNQHGNRGFQENRSFLMPIPAARRQRPTPNEAPFRHLVLFKFNAAAPAVAVTKVAAYFAA